MPGQGSQFSVPTKTITWRVRETPPSARFPRGVPEERLPADYEPQEVKVTTGLSRRYQEAQAGSQERAEALNCLDVIHEAKVLLGARVLTDEEVEEMWGSRYTERAEAEAPPEPERPPTLLDEVPLPVGTPGRLDGRVPSFTVEEAQQVFLTWKGDEFEKVSRIIFASALDGGEFHSETLVGVTLSQPNVIGAATNSLAKRGLIAKGEPNERRVSSPTSRRKSDVWRLTEAGRVVAVDLREHGVI